jgi:hypothetical protein
MDPITAALNIGTQLIGHFFPNQADADAAKLKLLELQQNGTLLQITGQLDINKVEAANASTFVSGWRPFVGWVCGFGLVYSFIGQPLLAWYSNAYHFAIPPTLDLGTLLTILGGMLGLGSLRTVEKINGVSRS